MTDTLERAAARVRALPSPLRWDDIEQRAATSDPIVVGSTGAADDRPRVVRPRTWIVAVAAVGLVAAFVAWPRGGADQEVRTEPSITTSPVTPLPSDPPPTSSGAVPDPAVLGSRSGSVDVLTDDAYLVWGGESGPTPAEIDRTDGFAIDLASGVVTEIPSAPIDPDSSAMGVWTGTELVVWSTNFGCSTCGASDSSAAAWNPATRTWRSVAAPALPGVGGGSAAVWTGEQIVTVTSVGDAAAYVPEDDRWTSLPSVDAATPGRYPGRPSLVWTGDEVLFWSTSYFAGPYPGEVGSVIVDRGWRWAPGAGSWTPMPDLPEGHRTTQATAAWTGEQLVVWGTAAGGPGQVDVGVGARWDPDVGTWRPMAPSPQLPDPGWDGTMGSQAVVDDGAGQVIVRPLSLSKGVEAPGPLLRYEPTTDTWRTTTVTADRPFLIRDGVVLVADPAAPVAGRL